MRGAPRGGLPRAALLAGLLLSTAASHGSPLFDEGDETPEVTVGRRLFFETRFSQFFHANSGGHLNRELPRGDPVVGRTAGLAQDLPGPFAGRSINCRACHLVNEHQGIRGAGVRTYTDYAPRSPVPARDDGLRVTPRRSPILVNSTAARALPILLHADGEFASIEDLVRGTLLGRNFGWLPGEASTALRHLASVIRQDDGTDRFARQTARLPYATLLAGTDPGVPPFVRIPGPYRIEVSRATDPEVLGAVARLIGAYVDSLLFAAFKPDGGALYSGSPYDAFLVKNGLPRRPNSRESDLAYARRLRRELGSLANPAWVAGADGAFKLHEQPFGFGPKEFEGLKIFLAEPSAIPPSPTERTTGRIGSCVTCHTPPAFTDFGFHNTGGAQEEYDALHGPGTFEALAIPSLARRNETPDLYLPASSARPAGLGPFRSVPSASHPGETDLGLWNVFANDAIPAPQEALRDLLGASNPPTACDLARTVALFKTPTVRDLGQTGPYFHTGRMTSVEAVLEHYVRFSELGRAGRVRNGDPRLQGVAIIAADRGALGAFLRSLNEDYND